ncbi:uncharacterized protein LOC125939872 [Dermacentor silvarum]|uniref:uncharacterized protein LOC125939872 n=1 Tax=Dermacentor silvarum TaxID=543639 RepID=UPI0021007547|nr:uncharacterized protein LOC125939872 [Dermacentor silvarum]
MVILTVHGADPPRRMTLHDLIEFLNTTERIWLYQRSYSQDDVMCINYETISVTQNSYLYDLRYVMAKTVKQRFGVGILGQTKELVPYMNITQVTGSPQYRKVLFYRNFMHHCAVFVFPYSGKLEFAPARNT